MKSKSASKPFDAVVQDMSDDNDAALLEQSGMNDEPEDRGIWYPIRYSVWEYTFPTDNTIETVRFDDKYMHVEFVDERILSIPLAWIPPVRDVSPAEREKVRISEDRTILIWDPDEGEANEILRIEDYLIARERPAPPPG
jgi:hypothetical protein